MQLVPITTDVVSSNPAQRRCNRYNIIQLMTFNDVDTRIYFPRNIIFTEARWPR